jgi:hypothetical protein
MEREFEEARMILLDQRKRTCLNTHKESIKIECLRRYYSSNIKEESNMKT